MPTLEYYGSPTSHNPRKWTECLRKAKQQLIEAGFDRLSAKLPDKQRKIALKLFHGK
jgi:hypothetical protein